MNRKSQSSVEYLFVVAIALLMIIPASVIFYRYSSDSQSGLISSQIYKTGNDMIHAAELMYSIGPDSWKTVDVTLPPDVSSVIIYNDSDWNELVLTYGPYDSSAVFFTKTILLNSTASDCSTGCVIPVHSGKNSIRVESYTDGVVRYRVIV